MTNGCYAETGPLKIHWRKVSQGLRGKLYKEFCKDVQRLHKGQLWRHNQAGDLIHSKGQIHTLALKELVKANKNKRGFTYTHHLVLNNTRKAVANRHAISHANTNGFTINLSANNVSEADRLADLQIAPVTTVVPETQLTSFLTPKGRRVVICPAVTHDISCADCQLCAISTRKSIVAFPAHGYKKKSMSLRIVQNEE